jgi:hypothetical protein
VIRWSIVLMVDVQTWTIWSTLTVREKGSTMLRKKETCQDAKQDLDRRLLAVSNGK